MNSLEDVDPALKRACSQSLLEWFSHSKRDLPWRYNRTPYRVWISELMLQQTRVDTVIPYYTNWMQQFPDIQTLANADLGDVLKAWEGLGYYARARNLHKAARMVMTSREGQFPTTYKEMLTLPGVGAYTAAAIASLSLGEVVPVLDGNVFRVLSRLTCYQGEASQSNSRKEMTSLATSLIPKKHPGPFNEAMMELGAMICTPRNPRCDSCPLKSVCLAFDGGKAHQFPVIRTKKKVPHKIVGAGVILNSRGEVLLARRPENKMLGGLWEFPGGTLEKGETLEACVQRELMEELGVQTRMGPFITKVRHAYSHFTIELHAYAVIIQSGRPRCIECSDLAWVKPGLIETYALSKADIYIRDAIQDMNLKSLYRTIKSKVKDG